MGQTFNGSYFGWAGRNRNKSTSGTVTGEFSILFRQNSNIIMYLGVLEDVAYDWKEIIAYVGVMYLGSDLYIKVNSSLINWSLIPQYPACQTIFLSK